MKILWLIAIIVLLTINLVGQQPVQTIRGIVTDKDTKTPLIGVNIVLSADGHFIGTNTNQNGDFVIDNLPVGRKTILFTYIDYKEQQLDNIEIISGKETVLNVSMEESVKSHHNKLHF
jgi:hypothetical protein